MKNCKKLLAFILSMLLVFTMALNPVITVAAMSEKTEIVEVEAEAGGFFDSVINWLVDSIHNLVGGFLSIFDEECPFCDKVHGKESEDKSAADEYFENNAQLIDTIEVDKSKDMLTESEVKINLAERGFNEYPITYEHSLNGDLVDETEVLDDSEEKHPMYRTIYISKNKEAWVIYVINGEIFANPIDFNSESDLDVELLISESEVLTSYDDETNKFYITIPFDSTCLTIPIEKIDAETLDELTVEKICDLSGATISISEDVDNDTLDIDSISTYSFDESFTSFSADTNNNVSAEDPFIVVSLGDSYSSGEGIEPFYGQDKSLFEKVKDQDWLAHRSKKSWPSLLKVPGVTGSTTMSEFRVSTDSTSSTDIQWYFGAVSGAETRHFNKNKQKKEYLQYYKDGVTTITHSINDVEYLPKQLDVFNNIHGKVDYVTLTVGGNDVGFADIIFICAVNSAYLYFGRSSKLEDKLTDLRAELSTTKANIKEVYEDIEDAAGSQASIIVAGYPKLLNKDGIGRLINKKEAQMVNENVSYFNDEIEKIVNECRSSGMNIYFVDVEDEFDGHEAYSSDAWINKIIIGSQSQDIKHNEVSSAYSIHPNEKGAKAYARCVNAKIEDIEYSKIVGELPGNDDEECPDAPNSNQPLGEIVSLYNFAINKAIDEKAGYSKQRTTTVSELNAGSFTSAVSGIVKDFFGEGTKEVKNLKGAAKHLQTSTLTASDVKSATCTLNDNKYTIALNLKDGSSYATEESREDNSAIAKSGLIVGKITTEDADYMNSECFYSSITTDPSFACEIREITATNTNAKIVIVIDAETGKMLSYTASFAWDFEIDEIEFEIFRLKKMICKAQTDIIISNFEW